MDIEYYDVAISKSGQITLPKVLRDLLNVKTGDRVLLKREKGNITLTTEQQALLDSFARIDARRKEEERKNPKILENKKKYAGMTFNEIRDAYDATPEGRKEFKERYGLEIKV